MEHTINIIALILTVVCTLFILFRTKKTFDKMEKEITDWTKKPGNVIGPLREKQEDPVYDVNQQRVQDALGYDDAAHIVLDSSKSLRSIEDRVPNFSYFDDLKLDINNTLIEENKVVCLMPFNKHFSSIYNTIKTACRIENFVCSRTDEELIEDNNNLRKYIIGQILSAKVIVAVLDGLNPNVFYEIGIAHAVGKLVILIANVNDLNKVPTDFKAGRVIFYDSKNKLREQLIDALKQIKNA